MTYEDVTYQLDAAGDVSGGLPAGADTQLVILATVDGRQHVLNVSEVRCDVAADGTLTVALVCGAK